MKETGKQETLTVSAYYLSLTAVNMRALGTRGNIMAKEYTPLLQERSMMEIGKWASIME
jgi:hypothetical protein